MSLNHQLSTLNHRHSHPSYLCKLKSLHLEKQHIIFEDLGIINYKAAWDYQEELVKANVDIKAEARNAISNEHRAIGNR